MLLTSYFVFMLDIFAPELTLETMETRNRRPCMSENGVGMASIIAGVTKQLQRKKFGDELVKTISIKWITLTLS